MEDLRAGKELETSGERLSKKKKYEKPAIKEDMVLPTASANTNGFTLVAPSN